MNGGHLETLAFGSDDFCKAFEGIRHEHNDTSAITFLKADECKYKMNLQIYRAKLADYLAGKRLDQLLKSD